MVEYMIRPGPIERFLRSFRRTPKPKAIQAKPLPHVDYRTLMESSLDAICQVEIRQGSVRFTDASAATSDIFGWNGDEFLSLTLADIFTAEACAIIAADIARFRGGASKSTVVLEGIRRNGGSVWVENKVRLMETDDDGTLFLMIGMRDVTERKHLQDQLAQEAMLDGLTGLYNRHAFDQRFAAEWNMSLRTGMPVSIVLLDVDHFKLLNDAYGHPVGD